MYSASFTTVRRLLVGSRLPRHFDIVPVRRRQDDETRGLDSFVSRYRWICSTPHVSFRRQNGKDEKQNDPKEEFTSKKGFMKRFFWWMSLGCGTGIGYAGAHWWNNNVKKIGIFNYNVECAPQKNLRDPLKLTNAPPLDPLERIKHDFRWEHTIEAVEISSVDNINTILQNAMTRPHSEWEDHVSKILGKQKYRTVKVHHVILDDIDKIIMDIKIHVQNRKLSDDYPDCIWLNKRRVIATFIYDEGMDTYRVYIYAGFCLLKFVKDGQGNLAIPSEIKFISDFAKPMNAAGGDPLVKEVVENFDANFLRWQENTTFIY